MFDRQAIIDALRGDKMYWEAYKLEGCMKKGIVVYCCMCGKKVYIPLRCDIAGKLNGLSGMVRALCWDKDLLYHELTSCFSGIPPTNFAKPYTRFQRGDTTY